MNRTMLVFAATMLASCSREPAQPPGGQSDAKAATITITTKSPEALAHFTRGETLFDNIRQEEAAEAFAAALKIDPDFVLARAYHGDATPGPEGLKEIESAVAAAKQVSEPERTLIEGIAARRRGDAAQAQAAFARLRELAPGDWRGHYLLGLQLMLAEKYPESAASLTKAADLNPTRGAAQNLLGYVALRQGDTEGAIKAFTEYGRLLPQEPNAQDSLGEALLAAGRFKEAEVAFHKALELSPEFWTAHQGIAYARFYAGDWSGGREALKKAKTAAKSPGAKIGLDIEAADAATAQRNTAEALRILDAAERTEGAQPFDLAIIPVIRSWALLDGGRARDALVPIAAALKTVDSGQLPPSTARDIRAFALRNRITVEAMTGDADAARKTAAALEQEGSSATDNPIVQDVMHYGRGQLAMVQRDYATARTHFDKCSAQDQICKWQGQVAAEKAGDKAAATAARDQLLKAYLRGSVPLIVRSRLSPVGKT